MSEDQLRGYLYNRTTANSERKYRETETDRIRQQRRSEPMMKRKPHNANDPSFDNNVKIIKTEKDATAADYSQDVKKKINASNRTGQACDRCRVRPQIEWWKITLQKSLMADE